MSVNKAILVGRLGQDPESRTIDSGVKMTKFSIATNETFQNKNGEKVEKTEWHNIVLWGGLADVAEKYLKKGDQVYIEGRIETRTYEQDNVKKYFTEIRGLNMTMLGAKRDNEQSSGSEVNEPEKAQPKPEDDLPF
ncbi:MAG: single-stranded DNA-binding protein [Bacteroidales bacterium]|nr:single-stranded DNA-binding protein [Bacteroidales bacterium]MCF8386718.1 single-stranded DNA-binding protein [Bacteroidales bacterium]MCF8397209.1 single-stranded DNA-binding protein [Bacteroidales bacterium]